MNPLEEFAAYFRAVHGHEPFPWQLRLLERLLREGWPASSDLPTSSGKTSFIDLAVFHLSLEAGRPAAERRAPVRIFFVIDRRVVVDEAFERAQRIVHALRAPSDPVLAGVANRLRRLSGDGDPLECAMLRGGMYRDDTWARSPRQPTVVVSTVDQVGSRLLFRGYGLRSGRAWPVHAGLVGHDALIILDEAHCSGPLVETLCEPPGVAGYRTWAERPVSGPFHVVTMSATLQARAGERFSLAQGDLDHPVLGPRLMASKPTRRVQAQGDVRRGALVKALVTEALALADPPGVVGVIVNRVATARECFDALAQRGEAILLTGRVRPFDRAALLRKYRDVLFAAPGRTRPERPVFVVATQCIEVGANLDFDALVTECASLDALRQRFGRLNRLGRAEPSPAVVVAHEDTLASDDPIYGPALPATWSLLGQLEQAGRLDFGVQALGASLDGQDLACCTKSARRAPVLLPAHLDLLCQTFPAPSAQPDPALFLHGEESGVPEVRVVWRRDLPGEGGNGDPTQPWAETIALLPPTSVEAMPVPLHAVRGWLAGHGPQQAGDPGADLDSATTQETREPAAHACPPVLRWRGPDESEVVRDIRDLRPGDTIVVPASYGGCDDFGWCPGRIPRPGAPVTDLGELAYTLGRARVALRLTAAVKPDLPEDLAEAWESVAALTDVPDDRPSIVHELLEALAASTSLDETTRSFAQHLRGDPQVLPHPGGGVVVVGRRRLDRDELLALSAHEELRETLPDDFVDEDDTSVVRSREVGLADHSAGVRALAEAFARSVGLDDALVEDLALAGWLHDVGKIDPRFQVWLRGGDRLAASGGPLAKSCRLGQSREQRRRARQRSGYPEGGRHELLSVRLAEGAPLDELAHDRDLVLHLIASHHGYCRPMAPVVVDREPCSVPPLEHGDLRLSVPSSVTGLEALDSGVTDRFWRLVRRYGWWGLAYLEATLRLADCRRSELEDHEGAPRARKVEHGRTVAAGA